MHNSLLMHYLYINNVLMLQILLILLLNQLHLNHCLMIIYFIIIITIIIKFKLFNFPLIILKQKKDSILMLINYYFHSHHY